ncbi:hypothetical protein NLJ89_g7171 [Agrocybe chaxingu]|uniref:Cytochrome P450 n=1 Tax=Agrocybe chaxingu TaxID=84603 RepID=A0A9W8JXP6_9AGAR|nr:hypothetical protein NLJ89_g7171 [Agrocybe chaxingu]
MDFLFGYQIDSLDDPAILAANKSLDIGNPLFTVGGSLITVFPFLARVPAWVPGAISQKRAAEGRYWTHEMKRIPLEDVRRRMDEGRATPSLVSQLLEKKITVGIADEDEHIMNNVAFTTYGAASDTTISVTNTFFYAMSLHPEVQVKAQAEIDRVVGTHRLPEFTDRPSMPYIEAIYRELLRYGPPVPPGVMHTLAEDDYYREYFLPKGSQVFANIWAMTHDESVYKDPETFNPDRFITEDGELNDDDRVLAYGFGRRICVGKHVASSTMWITIVSILACFNIGKAKDEFGNEIEVNGKYDDDGLLVHKQPFKCSIVPRSELARKLIEEAALN